MYVIYVLSNYYCFNNTIDDVCYEIVLELY